MSILGNCPKCKKPLDEDKCIWGGGNTEAGTDFWTFNVDCDCGWDFETSGWGENEGLRSSHIEEIKEEIDALESD